MTSLNEINFAILAGGLNHDGSLPDRIIKVCDYIIDRINVESRKCRVICSSAFSLNTPPKLDINNIPISESSSIAKYIETSISDVRKVQILCEQFSHDTVGNLIFLSEMFVKNFRIKALEIAVIDYHSDRVILILKKLKKLNFFLDCNVNIRSIDSGISHSRIKERIEHEQKASEKFSEEVSMLKSKRSFLRHMLTNHSCMNCCFSGRRIIDNELY